MEQTSRYIDHTESLEKTIEFLNRCDAIAIDLEFDKNYYHYGFNLCLVQIYSDDQCFLIDPLSDQLEIESLFPILEDKNVQKICFSFDEDLRLLHSLGCFPKNLYDLSIASRLLNDPPASLTNLLQEHLNIDTGSSSQQSNWFKRPLTKKQLHYAANDVYHLFKLKDFMEAKASENGVIDWIRQENECLDQLDYSDVDHNGFIKEKDMSGFSEFEWHIFKELLRWQDEMGEMYNRPAYQIAPKRYLIEIAKDSRKLMQWNRTDGIFKKLKSDDVKSDLIALIKSASKEAEEQNYSQTQPARNDLSREEYKLMMKQKSEINRAKNEIFKPIKTKIEECYGSDLANFLLSNRLISDMVTGNNGSLPDYRKELFLKYAKELSLNMDAVQKYVG
ncbi:MAG: hypothetical protein WD513_04695 [Balneolaceae bacterium]